MIFMQVQELGITTLFFVISLIWREIGLRIRFVVVVNLLREDVQGIKIHFRNQGVFLVSSLYAILSHLKVVDK